MESSEILMALIKPSPTNPRKKFDESKLLELAESIKAKGVLQPILVRPFGPGHYQLVAGERRFRAAKLAGLVKIPAVVRVLDDNEALEIQVIENDQREDVLPSERAHAYQQLRKAGRTIQEIAEKVGKSPSTIRDALRFARLPEKLAEATDAGVISTATAQLVGRVPNEGNRYKVSLCVLNGRTNPHLVTGQSEPLSYRQTAELIREHFIRELKTAPFDWKDATLPPGSCEDCPKRAGNAGEEYKSVRGDMCLDTACYSDKAKLNAERKIKTAVDDGFTLLTKDQQEMLFHGGDRLFSTGIFAWLDTKLDFAFQQQVTQGGGPEFKTLRGFLGGKLKDMEIFLCFSPVSKTRCEFVSYDEVKRVVDELYPSKREKPKPRAVSPEPKQEPEAKPSPSDVKLGESVWDYAQRVADQINHGPMLHNKLVRLVLAAVAAECQDPMGFYIPNALRETLREPTIFQRMASPEAQKPGANSVMLTYEDILVSWAALVLAQKKDRKTVEAIAGIEPLEAASEQTKPKTKSSKKEGTK